MAITKILVGVDFSDQSDLAFRSALGLARRFGAEIQLVHVSHVPEWPRGLDVPMRRDGGEFKKRLDRHIDEDELRLRKFHQRHRDEGVPISLSLKSGHPAWGIVDAAADLSPDLVVVGSRGLSPLERLLLGSVAARVARLVRTPVLVVRSQGDPPDGFHRVLVATDFSDTAIRALDLTHTVASRKAIIDLVNFWRIPGTESWEDEPGEPLEMDADPLSVAVHQQVEEAGINWMKGLRRMDNRATFHLVNQEPVDGILDWTDMHRCDLVVLGDRGHQRDHHPVLGSVTRATLRRASCSVLIAR